MSAPDRLPAGHNRCTHCGRLSPLYDLWVSCRDCLEETCDECDVPAEREDVCCKEHPATTRCRGCVAEDAVPPIRTVCMCCGAVIVDVPEDARGVSHGVCDMACWQQWSAARRAERQ